MDNFYPPESQLYRLLLRIYICTDPPSLHAAWCTSWGWQPPPYLNTPSTNVVRVSAQDHPPTKASHVSVPSCRCIRPLPYPSLSLLPSLRPFLATATPAGFLLPLHPCRFQNRFYRDFQLILRYLLPPPWHPEFLPSLTTRISYTNIKNRSYVNPLCHYFLAPIHIFLERLCPSSL